MANINQQAIDTVAAILADAYYDDQAEMFTTTYSGRGMCGHQCVGFYADPHHVIAAFATAVTENRLEDWDMDFMEMASTARQDNMGHGTITYFPGLQFISE